MEKMERLLATAAATRWRRASLTVRRKAPSGLVAAAAGAAAPPLGAGSRFAFAVAEGGPTDLAAATAVAAGDIRAEASPMAPRVRRRTRRRRPGEEAAAAATPAPPPGRCCA